MLLGIGVPALVSGIVSSKSFHFQLLPGILMLIQFLGFQTETRDSIPGWDGLLFVYGVLLIPVVFSLLVGINLLVWSHSRINYIFIFGKSHSTFYRSIFAMVENFTSELDPRTRLDHREYFEVCAMSLVDSICCTCVLILIVSFPA